MCRMPKDIYRNVYSYKKMILSRKTDYQNKLWKYVVKNRNYLRLIKSERNFTLQFYRSFFLSIKWEYLYLS